MFLTRLRLRPECLQARHWPRGLPHHDLYAQHRFVWDRFDGAAARSFLFRAPLDADQPWLILSAMPPAPDPRLELETKPFAPRLQAGQRLAFQLRLNATRCAKLVAGRGRREDVVAHARRRDPAADPAAVVLAWLAEQGRDPRRPETSLGFGEVALTAFARRLMPLRKPGRAAVKLAVHDLAGTLRIDDPVRFTDLLGTGIGRARAFGCGLLLVRPLAMNEPSPPAAA